MNVKVAAIQSHDREFILMALAYFGQKHPEWNVFARDLAKKLEGVGTFDHYQEIKVEQLDAVLDRSLKQSFAEGKADQVARGIPAKMLCTECGEVVEDGRDAVFGADRGDGKLEFGWTCCHRPVGKVAIVLGSGECAKSWIGKNAEYASAVRKLVMEHGRAIDPCQAMDSARRA